MSELLAGKAAIVIGGGGGGIGHAVSLTLARAGARCGVVDVDKERAEATAGQIEAAGGKALARTANVLDSTECSDAITGLGEALGGVDVLVTVVGGNRGLAPWQPAHTHTDEQWEAVMSMNLRYVFFAVRSAITAMLAQGRGGAIVSVGSVSGMAGAPNHLSYGVGKAGVIHMARSVAIEYGRHGIRMNTVSPGRVRTPATSDTLGPEQTAIFAERIPLGRVAEPEDIANAVLFLASPLSSLVSGQNIVVDGGASCRFPLPLPGADPSEAF